MRTLFALVVLCLSSQALAVGTLSCPSKTTGLDGRFLDGTDCNGKTVVDGGLFVGASRVVFPHIALVDAGAVLDVRMTDAPDAGILTNFGTWGGQFSYDGGLGFAYPGLVGMMAGSALLFDSNTSFQGEYSYPDDGGIFSASGFTLSTTIRQWSTNTNPISVFVLCEGVLLYGVNGRVSTHFQVRLSNETPDVVTSISGTNAEYWMTAGVPTVLTAVYNPSTPDIELWANGNLASSLPLFTDGGTPVCFNTPCTCTLGNNGNATNQGPPNALMGQTLVFPYAMTQTQIAALARAQLGYGP